jgi:hypothetical protein
MRCEIFKSTATRATGISGLNCSVKIYSRLMKEVIITAVLIMGVASWFVVRARAQESKPAKSTEQEARRAAFSDLRKQALTGTRAAFGLDATTKPTLPWGVVMETGFAEGSFTLVALSDGSASIYLSSGGGSIGGSAHETIRKAAKAMVALAAKFQPDAVATKEFPLPKDGQTIFYLLTDAGVFTVTASEQDLGEDRHAWSPLFHAGHEVISQYRIIEERK